MSDENVDEQIRQLVIAWARSHPPVAPFLRELSALCSGSNADRLIVGADISELHQAALEEADRRREAEEESLLHQQAAAAAEDRSLVLEATLVELLPWEPPAEALEALPAEVRVSDGKGGVDQEATLTAYREQHDAILRVLYPDRFEE